MLTVKKYANGRFYDTVNKRYLTRDQLSQLIEDKIKIRVVLAKTGKDVTKAVVASLATTQNAKTNDAQKPLWKKASMKTWVAGHRQWMVKRIDNSMDTILAMMNFPHKRQVAKLDADMRKLAEKFDDLQKRQAQRHAQMRLEHKKEMKILAQQYEKRIGPAETAPAVQGA
jgi:hypothetical protein